MRHISISSFIYAFALTLFCKPALTAQSLSGSVRDSLKSPASFIPIALLQARDSSVLQGTNTNEQGYFVFEGMAPGTYLLKVQAAGFKTRYSPLYKVDSLLQTNAGELILEADAVNLSEVSVTAVKKLVEFRNGNITVNVENSPLAVGNSLYDLLLRLPTVTITDDIISIQGKNGARVLIDERPQQLNGQPLINLLKSIQASTIEKIEILKNPPVKYDAAGTGFISVKTKKMKITGFSGNANLSYQQGFYANKDAGFSLNYKGRSFAVFSSLNTGSDESRYTSFFNKRISFNGLTTEFDQVTVERSRTDFVFYSLGADWYLDKNNTLGFRIDGSEGHVVHDRSGINTLSDASLGYTQLLFANIRPNTWSYLNYNLNAEHRFDTLGTQLRFSLDYSPNQDLNSGDFKNFFLDPSGNTSLAPRIFKSDNDLQFILYTAKLDFEKQLRKTLRMETGMKGNLQDMNTHFNFNSQDPLSGDYTPDTTFTNGFSYREEIYAGYFNFMKEFKKFSAQLGIRGEYTHIYAGSIKRDIAYTREYFNLFPLLSLNYNPGPDHSYQLSYNRRINRPNYTSFNPYKYFVNLLVAVQGNPYLVPEYYNTVEFTHSFKSFFHNTLYFSAIDNIFYGYPVQNDSTKETLEKSANLSRAYNYGYACFLQKDVFKWWMLTFNGVVNYFSGTGKVEGVDYSGTSFQAQFFLNNQLNLPRKFKMEVAGRYIAPANIVVYRHKGMWAVDFAIRKALLKEKLNLVIGMNDIFYSWIRQNSIRYQNIHSDFRATFDTRRFKLSLSYNFGKVKVQQRQTKSNQEEKKRLEH